MWTLSSLWLPEIINVVLFCRDFFELNATSCWKQHTTFAVYSRVNFKQNPDRLNRNHEKVKKNSTQPDVPPKPTHIYNPCASLRQVDGHWFWCDITGNGSVSRSEWIDSFVTQFGATSDQASAAFRNLDPAGIQEPGPGRHRRTVRRPAQATVCHDGRRR